MRFGFCIFLILLVWASAAWAYIAAQKILAEPGVITYQEYQGRYHFTPEEYSAFKQYLADNKEVKIIKMDVYSSSDPLVEFTLAVGSSLHIPYGEQTKQLETEHSIIMTIFVMTNIIISMVAIGLTLFTLRPFFGIEPL